MALAPRDHSIEKGVYTEDEYFEFEQTSIGHWKYVNGEIRAMSGGSDMKVHTGDGINTFPDIYALIEWAGDTAV